MLIMLLYSVLTVVIHLFKQCFLVLILLLYSVLTVVIHLFKTVLSSVDSAIVQCVNCCHTSIQNTAF